MRLDNFDLNLLVAFEALMAECNVTRAAARLHVSQPAMSASLKRLRESFRDELLIPHGNRMIPTQHAITLAPEVTAALTRLKGIIATNTSFNPATSGRRFRIAISDYATTVIMAPLVEVLATEAPGIKLHLNLPGFNSMTQLENGEVDLLVTPEECTSADHPCQFLLEERHVVVGWRGNRAMRLPMTQEAFLRCGHVAVRISDRDSHIDASLTKLLPERRVDISAQSLTQVPWLVRGTNRLALMQQRLAAKAAPMFDLMTAEPPFQLPVIREMVQCHIARAEDEGLQWLQNRIRQFAASL